MTVARLELKNRVYRLATSVRRLRSGSHGASGNEEIVFSDQFLPRRCHQPRRLPLAKMSQQRYRRVASLHCGLTVVCAENSDPDVLVMQTANKGM
jgi:hypothetical protein